ncbi:MAG: ISNCY family transposase [Desulfuromonadales bacterium]|nr:ISNCY family transposase [Desulfuromonadales bacterium]
MRQKRNPQLDLFTTVNKTQIGKELEQMSKILDETPELLQVVFDDLVKAKRADTGRQGLTAEQVLRCATLKQYRQLSYEELAFHLDDSSSFRRFARLERGQYPRKSVLQENIKAISEQSWEEIHHLLIDYAIKRKIEKGRKIRIDSTAIETDIHHPTDSTLLADGIRIITRWLAAGKALSQAPVYRYSDHSRVVKKRVMTILNTKKDKIRKAAYQDLLQYAQRVVNYALPAIAELHAYQGLEFLSARGIAAKLERAVGLLGKVMDQTRRRVINGEKVPASEKVVSFFEDHSDIIVKGQRDTTYGHKVFFTGGVSTLILDCLIEQGNPADSERYQTLLERQKSLLGRMPRQVSADGGFASKDNLDFAKAHQVKDAVFAKRRGLSVLDMAKSQWVYKRLRNFRAGIEAGISVLKRAFGLDRCTWSGWAGFKRYVWSSIVSYNLLAMARIRLA